MPTCLPVSRRGLPPEPKGRRDRARKKRAASGRPSGEQKTGYFQAMSPRQAPRDLRASDADRDRVLALLAEAMSDGRLTADEHAERLQRAFSARTLGELAELTTDLAVPSAQPVR